MKKTIICTIPMKQNVDLSVYSSDDSSIPVSNRKVRYPINALLEETLEQDDEIKVILLIKEDDQKHYLKNKNDFIDEINQANAGIGAKIEIVSVNTAFSEERQVHEELMGIIVDEIEDGCHVTVDITYGPKDIPIVIFSALGFAEKFLECEIDGIIYGQAYFVDGHVTDTKVCDMSPLYYLGSVSNSIQSDNPDKARKMLKSLLCL